MVFGFSNPQVTPAVAAVAFSILAASPVGAASVGFVGDFDVANFTHEVVGNGSVDLSNAPHSIAIVGTEDESLGSNAIAFGINSFTTTVPADTIASFDYAFATTDINGPLFDPFVVIINDTAIQIVNDIGPNEQFGRLTYVLAAGNTFGFGINSLDGIQGAASVTISNFEAAAVDLSAAVPEPMTVMGSLFGGVALLGAHRKMANKAK